jgi:hypothetical protein
LVDSFFTECEFDGAVNYNKEREGRLSVSDSGERTFLVSFWLGYELCLEEERYVVALSAAFA